LNQDLAPEFEPNVFARMAKDAQEKPKRDDEKRKKMLELKDLKTGKPLFKPQLIQSEETDHIKSKRKGDIKKNGGIGNYLY